MSVIMSYLLNSICMLVLILGMPVLRAVAASESSNASSRSPNDKKLDSEKSEKTLIFIGDSLTEGYGVNLSEAFPEVVRGRLTTQGHKVRVINGGISGSVSADADRRVRWYLKTKPDVLILALGANDGLKGTPPETVKKNLAAAIDLAKSHQVKVLLCGIRLFTNFGPDYTKKFERIYHELAKEKGVPFIPFLLEDVALKKELNQSDGKHPNAKGHKLIGERVARELEKLL